LAAEAVALAMLTLATLVIRSFVVVLVLSRKMAVGEGCADNDGIGGRDQELARSRDPGKVVELEGPANVGPCCIAVLL